jgi:hypothetical protein
MLTLFILFRQWAAHWLQWMTGQASRGDGRWPTSVLGSKGQAASG